MAGVPGIRISLSNIDIPVTFLAGKWDVFAGAQHVLSAAQRIKGSRYRELDATHFIALEFSDIVLDELKDLLRRVTNQS